MPELPAKAEAFTKLLEVVYELREKCPWDRKQTWESLRPMTVEELYELMDALAGNDTADVERELGDVLLHVLFYAMIAEEQLQFDIAGVCDKLRTKLIARHPHIYGEVKVENDEDVKRNWERIKLNEGSKSLLAGVPKSMPALVKALRLQEKAAAVGFDWPTRAEVLDKVREEVDELEVVAQTDDQAKLEDEFGDVFFSLVNYARAVNINPEAALERTNKKFIRRFNHIEAEALRQGRNLEDMTLDEMDVYWNAAKKEED